MRSRLGPRKGVPQDYVLAHMWSNLAASQLPPGENRDMAVGNRDKLVRQMTPDQIAEALRLAPGTSPRSHALRRRCAGHAKILMLFEHHTAVLPYSKNLE